MTTRQLDARKARAPRTPYVPPGARGRPGSSAASRSSDNPQLNGSIKDCSNRCGTTSNKTDTTAGIPERAGESRRRVKGMTRGGREGERKEDIHRNADDADLSASPEKATEPSAATAHPAAPLAQSAGPSAAGAKTGLKMLDDRREENAVCSDSRGQLQHSLESLVERASQVALHVCSASDKGSPLSAPATERARDGRHGAHTRRKPRQAWSQYVPPRRRETSPSPGKAERPQRADTSAASMSPSAPATPLSGAEEGSKHADRSRGAPAPGWNMREGREANSVEQIAVRLDAAGEVGVSVTTTVPPAEGKSKEQNIEESTLKGTCQTPSSCTEPGTEIEGRKAVRKEEPPPSRDTSLRAPRASCVAAASRARADREPDHFAAPPADKEQSSTADIAGHMPEATVTPSFEVETARVTAALTQATPAQRGASSDVSFACKAAEGIPANVSATNELGSEKVRPLNGIDGGQDTATTAGQCDKHNSANEGADEDEQAEEKPPFKPPSARYVPPGRRKLQEAASAYTDGRTAEGTGPLWTSRAPIRVSQRARPSDREASPSKPAPTRVAGVVSGGMSAYGANISEYSEHMSRDQVEACTALITNFPTALPPGQRDFMLKPFASLGALITWPRPDEALATFATPALARQAVSSRTNRSTMLQVGLLSEAREEKRKGYRRVELARPGRPPADASSASRLISGALGIRRPRAQAGDAAARQRAAASSSQGRIRGRGAKTAQTTESTDSWDM